MYYAVKSDERIKESTPSGVLFDLRQFLHALGSCVSIPKDEDMRPKCESLRLDQLVSSLR